VDVDLRIGPEGYPVSRYEQIRARGRIVWSDLLQGWLVWSYEDVKTVLGSPQRFTLEGTPISESFGKEAMLVTDAPLHHTMRSVWEKQVSFNSMESRAKDVHGMVARLLEPVIRRLKKGGRAELTALFEDFTAEGITWLMGMPASRAADLKRWNRLLSEAPVLAMDKGSRAFKRHFQTREKVYDFLRAEMEARRRRLAAGERLDDLVSLMVAAEVRGEVTRTQVADNILNFFTGAIDTTSRWMGNVFVLLNRHGNVLQEIRANRKLLAQTLEEVMRFETVPQLLLRHVRRDGIELAGRELKAEERIYVLPGAANRDPGIFDHPMTFDIHRDRNPHLGFGIGMHHCLGKNVAKVETLCLVEALLDLLPDIEIVDCDYGSSWALWGPVSLTIRLHK
jgi:cytochrome P450